MGRQAGHFAAPLFPERGRAVGETMELIIALTFLNILILIAGIGVLGLTLKLYTEYFKDKSQAARPK
jgi:hypothetical protein